VERGLLPLPLSRLRRMRATVNLRNNLAHCFCCKKNLNNIDLLMTLDYDFRSAVFVLQRWLDHYQAEQARKSAATPRAK
jgi:DNA primase